MEKVKCQLVLALWIYSIHSFPKGYPVVVYVLFPATYILPFFNVLRRQFLPKKWPIQFPFLLFTVCRNSSSPWLHVTLLHCSHDRPTWSPSLCRTTFQNNPTLYVMYDRGLLRLERLLDGLGEGRYRLLVVWTLPYTQFHYADKLQTVKR